MYYGNVTENGTAGMMVMTMTATDYDDLDEGTNAKLKYSIGRSSRTTVPYLPTYRTYQTLILFNYNLKNSL